MRVCDRHLGQVTVAGIALALAALLALDAVFSLIGELGDLGKGEYAIGHALRFVLLTLPRRAVELFPTATVVGALLGVGSLAATGELVAYRSAGLSRLRIALAVGAAAGVVLIPVLVVAEWVAPAGERLGQALRIGAQTGGVAIARDAGLWVRDGERIVHSRRPLASGLGSGSVHLADVDVFEFERGRLRNAAHATRGEHDGTRWRLTEVRRSRFEDGRVVTEQAAVQAWDSLLDPGLLRTAIARPVHLSLRELLPYVEYLEANGLDARAYRAAIWTRAAYPLATLAILLAGMPFVFGGLRGGGFGKRLFVGMLLGVGFYFVNRSAGSLGEVYALPPALVALGPSLALLAISAWLLRRGVGAH